MSWPSRTWGSGYQVDRWSSEISGRRVSVAYSAGLKQRTSPLPHESARRAVPGARVAAAAGLAQVTTRPLVAYTAPLPFVARSVAWVTGSSSETTTRRSSAASIRNARDGRYP